MSNKPTDLAAQLVATVSACLSFKAHLAWLAAILDVADNKEDLAVISEYGLKAQSMETKLNDMATAELEKKRDE